MPILIYFGKSKRKDKKKVMIFRNPSMNIHFGSNISKTYVEGASKKTRDNYLKRHRPRENWDKINAGSASAIILWGKSKNINTNLKNYIKKFGIKDNRKKYPKKYVPNVLSEKDRIKQIKSIEKGIKRPKLESFKSKRSSWAKRFENKYKTKITNKEFIHKNIIKKKGIELIISKGVGAYYSGGSRPNQTGMSWAYARLASVIMGGPARKSDKKIWDQYRLKK